MTDRTAGRAAAAAGAALLLLYLVTLAPSVTFWDAGEFIAAIETWGIPHPPGTPLYVTLGRTWRLVIPFLSPAVAASSLSAVCTAVGCALLGTTVGRRLPSPALAAGAVTLGAGVVSSVWLNATEAEVYAPSLLLAATMLFVADAPLERERRRLLLLAYLFGLAAPLHASALVAGPAAIVLAADRAESATLRRRSYAVLGACFLGASGIATGRPWIALAGIVLLLALAASRLDHAATAAPLLALGASPLAMMLLRARLDPAINQGNPATLAALLDVVARRQYAVAPLWPREAPPWLQLANLLQYADWQFALGIVPGTTFSPARLAVSLVYVALAVAGARAHARADRGGFRGVGVLMLSATLGVTVYLNLKAGPSIGWGVLHDDAPHEARERDYFFVLGFWAWGCWAALGALDFARTLARRRNAAVGFAFVVLPIVANWRATNRKRDPDVHAALAIARAHLEPLPPLAVLVTWGDNDSYPLWFMQRALRRREDVTVVTAPLLGARWYRDELRRRDSISIAAGPEEDMVAQVARAARARGRPVAFAPAVAASARRAAGGEWSHCGVLWLELGQKCEVPGRPTPPFDVPGAYSDPVVRMMLPLLQCSRLEAVVKPGQGAQDSLAAICNAR